MSTTPSTVPAQVCPACPSCNCPACAACPAVPACPKCDLVPTQFSSTFDEQGSINILGMKFSTMQIAIFLLLAFAYWWFAMGGAEKFNINGYSDKY